MLQPICDVKSENLWSTFDINVGLDNSFDQPTYNDVIARLENRFCKLNGRRSYCTSQNIPRSN
jgi:hypothetical protein